MIIAKSAFEFIEKNPGVMMRDIIAAFPQCNPMSVKNAVHRLYYEGRLASVQTPTGFLYRIAGTQTEKTKFNQRIPPKQCETWNWSRGVWKAGAISAGRRRSGSSCAIQTAALNPESVICG